MRNITVTVKNETYRQIRIWCAERNTCISHVVEALLNDLPNREDLESVAIPKTAGSLAPGFHLNQSRMQEIASIMRELEQDDMVASCPAPRRSGRSRRRAV